MQLCTSAYIQSRMPTKRTNVDQNSLETSDLILIAPPVSVPGHVADAIARRITDGGHLICLLDGPTAPNLIRALAGASKGAIAPPFQLLRPATATAGRGEPFARVNVAAGPLRAFADPARGDLAGLYFRRHFLTQNNDARQDEILCYFADGSAALAMSPAWVEEGRLRYQEENDANRIISTRMFVQNIDILARFVAAVD